MKAGKLDELQQQDQKKAYSPLLALCCAALCLSMPLNGLSPSLSLVAHEFGFSDKERDIYLGGYVALSTMMGQMLGSCISGCVVDLCSRKRLLVISLVLGSVSSCLFGMLNYFPALLALRIFTGGCQGAVVPVLFSLIADFYAVDEGRANISAIVSSCLGGGMMIGQLFTGFFLSILGWRVPFICMGGVTSLAAVYLHLTLIEPNRGAREDSLAELLSKGASLPPMSLATFIDSMLVPTVAIMMIQTIPNTVPWGVLSSHLHDLLATDAHLSMPEATSLIAVFGIGAAVGGLFGGFVGARLYSQSRALLPAFMGVTMAMSALLLRELLSMDLREPGAMQMACPVLSLAGALAAVNGANIRVIVLNLTSPEARGANIAVLNLVNCVGRGVGPSLIEFYMQTEGVSRRKAVSTFLNLWLFSGSLLVFASSTIARDEDRMKNLLRRFADTAMLSTSLSSGSSKKQALIIFPPAVVVEGTVGVQELPA